MDALQLMNNDMATLLICSKQLFEHWDDKVANEVNNKLLMNIQKDWNSYIDEINTRMKIYMRAEKNIIDAMKNLKNLTE